MKNKTKSTTTNEPFKVLKDGKRYYIPVPKHLQLLFGKTKYTSAVKSEMEIKAQELNAQCIRHVAVVTNPGSILDLFDRIIAAGYPGGTLQNFLQEQAYIWEARHAEPNLDALRTLYIADCHKRKRMPMINNLLRLQLPWPDKKISEFEEQRDAKAFIEEIERFLDTRIDFYHGTPWSKGTRNRWLGDFLAIVNFAIKRKLTHVRANPLTGVFDLSKPKDIGPDTFEMEDLLLFLTYVRYWYPKLYIPFVLATWGCIRLIEVSRMTWDMIHRGDPLKRDGRIDLTTGITKKEDHRIILEEDVPHLFELLRQAESLLGTGKKPVASVLNWSVKVEAAFRELFGWHWPNNGSRSTGASVLYFSKGMGICAKVMGHSFLGTDRILLKHYLDVMTSAKVKVFETMFPLDLTPQIKANLLYKMADHRCDITKSTVIWSNYRMQYMPRVNMRHTINEEFLRRKRPVFATARGNDLVVDILHRDGRSETKTFSCASADDALVLEQKWRIVTLTGLGRLDFETGQVYDYELNFGPLYNQPLYHLDRPQQLEELMRLKGKSVQQVAEAVGCATDFICRYMGFCPNKKARATGGGAAASLSAKSPAKPKKRLAIPERFVNKFRQLFPELVFVPASPSREEAWISRGCVCLPKHHARDARVKARRAQKHADLLKSSQEKKRSTIATAGHLH